MACQRERKEEAGDEYDAEEPFIEVISDDEILFDGIEIAVLSVVGRRIKKVKVNREKTEIMEEVEESE